MRKRVVTLGVGDELPIRVWVGRQKITVMVVHDPEHPGELKLEHPVFERGALGQQIYRIMLITKKEA